MISGSSTAAGAPEAAAAPDLQRAAPVLDAPAAGAGLAAALAVHGVGARGLVAACFLGSLAVLALIDLRTHLLPNRIVLPSAAFVLVLQLVLFPDDALEWVLTSVGCFAVLFALALARPGSLGMGDAKLGLLLGAGLGLDAAPAMLIGCLALWPVAAFLLARDGLGARNTAVPLGPALAFGAAVVVLTG